MRLHHLTAALVLLACAAPAAPARADDPPPPETADSLYNQGNDAYDREDYGLAYELFTGAFKLRKSYDIARNLGVTELKLGRYKAAIEHLSYSLSLYPSNRAETKKQVIEWLEQAKAQVGSLRLVVDPEGASCKVGGEPTPREQREAGLFIDPGDVKIECSAAGHRTDRRTVTIKKGERAEVSIDLVRSTAPIGPGAPDASTDLRRNLLWVGSAVAIAGVGVGAVTGVLSLTKASDADDLLAGMRQKSGPQPCASSTPDARCGELLALRREQDAFGNIAFWGLLAGGAIGAGTAVYGLTTRPRSIPAAPAPKASVMPVISPGAAAIFISGSW